MIWGEILLTPTAVIFWTICVAVVSDALPSQIYFSRSTTDFSSSHGSIFWGGGKRERKKYYRISKNLEKFVEKKFDFRFHFLEPKLAYFRLEVESGD